VLEYRKRTRSFNDSYPSSAFGIGATMTTRENIRVIPDTLNNVIVSVGRGQYRIPQFQREYVWEKSKVIELFDSIYKEFPIGSFFLWKAGREFNHLFRHSIDLNISPSGDLITRRRCAAGTFPQIPYVN
jgi:hypothetical protein